MLCHRCGTELAGAATCGNCGASAGRRRFRPTLTAFEAADPTVARAAAVGLEKGEIVGDQFALRDPLGEAPGGWRFAARGPGGLDLVVRFVGPLADADARLSALDALERARRLSHDNVVRVYAAGAHRDWLFTAHERLQGLTLATVCEMRREKGQPFTIAELLPIFEPLRDALMHAHRHLAHGGLDAAVIHILPSALKVADFGLAAALPAGHFARVRAAAGRAHTLAPEVLAGERPTPRSDIYSLGAIVYEMLTGRPFAADAPPPTVALGIMGAHPVDGVVARAVRPAPEERWPDIAAFAEAIAELADGPPLGLDDGERTRKVAISETDLHTTARLPVGPVTDPPMVTGRFDRAPAAATPTDGDGPTRPFAVPDDDPPTPGSEASGPPAVEDEPDTAPVDVPGDADGRRSQPPPVPSTPSSAGPPPPSPSGPPPPSPSGPPPPSSAGPPPPSPSAAPAPSPASPSAPPPLLSGPAGRGALVHDAGGGPSVLIDPAFARLDTAPPTAEFVVGADRTPTQPVRMPAPRPWLMRSNLGFGLVLVLIVGAVAAGALWIIRRNADEAPSGPTVRVPTAMAPVEPRQPPPVVIAAVEVDAAPVVVDAGPTPTRPAPAPSARTPKVARRAAPVAGADDRAPSTDRVAESPSAAPAPPVEPPPDAAASPPEPDRAAEPVVEPAPVAPRELRCPAGMVLVTHRDFPDGGKRRGVIVEAGIEAARAGQAYCIDAYEYPGRGELPRTGVNFEAARGLCLARGRRLCTDAEWRRGCAGRKGGAWPYGSAFDARRCNTEDADGEERALAPGGRFRQCKSLRGVFDMSGNAAEWTADQTVRGGDFAAADGDAACTGGGKRAPSSSRPSIGFRCCADFTE